MKPTDEIKHESTIFAEPIITIGNFPITNSLINTTLVTIFFVVLAITLRKRLNKIPRGLQNFSEIIIEGALKLCDTVTSSRTTSLKLFPLVFILFLFILINNWSGLLPGIGTIGWVELHDGESIFVPFFRGGTADVNTTLALALVSVILTHILGVMAVGGWHYLNKFVNLKALAEIPIKIWKEPTILLVNPVKFFIGLIEIIGEIAKIASLSFRLFGNMFAGEVLLASIAGLIAFVLPLPFMFLEIIVGLVQALVFSMLVLVFSTIAVTKEEH